MINVLLVDLVVAQDGGYNATPTAASGRTSAGTTATSSASSDGGEGGAAAAPSPFGGDFFIILILVMVAMFGFSIMSQRKQKKQRQQMMDTLTKRDVVQTIGGIIGTVVDIQGDRVVLCVHEGSNTRLTVSRSAVQTTLDAVARGDDADSPAQENEDE